MDIQKVEIVKPLKKGERSAVLVGSLLGTGFSILLVWWTLAAWVPELGITYWQTILPVFAFRSLFGAVKSWRYTTKKEEAK